MAASDRAEFYISSSRELHFYASWPKDADPNELRGVAGALPVVLEHWANVLEGKAQRDGEAEYASWSIPSGVKGPEHG
jgi:hypothetical protein